MKAKNLALTLGSLFMLAGAQMAQAGILNYNVTTTWYEPATQPNNTIFTGTFSFDNVSNTVSNLTGLLTQSMTGGCATMSGCPGSYGSIPMTTVSLTNQLSAVYDATLGGLLVTTFALPTTATFFGGTWTPADGVAMGGI